MSDAETSVGAMPVIVPTQEDFDALVELLAASLRTAADGLEQDLAAINARLTALEVHHPPEPEPEPPEPEPEPEPKPPAAMSVGTSLHREQGETHGDAYARRAENWGAEPDCVRLFDSDMGVPPAWPTKFGTSWPLWSFKVHPDDVLSGSRDDELIGLFRDAPTGRMVRWTYWHEPEDDVEDGAFSAADWRNAFDYINGIRDDHAPVPGKVPSGPVLMGWTVNPKSGRDPAKYTIAGGPGVKFYGWDTYAGMSDLEAGYRMCADYTASLAQGLKWLLAETGPKPTENYPDKSDWLKRSIQTARNLGAFAYFYFDSTVGGDFRLKLEPEWEVMGNQIRRD